MERIPFVVGQWVRGPRFFGRAALIDEILDGSRDAIWVIGRRRVGKTSLLKELEWRCASGSRPTGDLPIFWDLQGSTTERELQESFRDALWDVEEALREAGLDLDELESASLFETLPRLRRTMRSRGRRVLLLVDEAEELLSLQDDDPATLRRLRRVLLSGHGLRCVLASTVRLWSLAQLDSPTSPFLHGFTPPLHLAQLDDDDADGLLHQANAPPEEERLDAQSVRRLRAAAGDHPFLLQVLGKRALERGDAATAIDEVAGERMVTHVFEVDDALIGRAERLVLRELAKAGRTASTDEIAEAAGLPPPRARETVRDLERLGFVVRDGDAARVRGEILEGWLAEAPRETVAAIRASGEAEASEDASSRTSPGWRDDRFVLLEPVGRGAMGVVYRAADRVLDETVAIKVLHPELSADPHLLERFRQETVLQRRMSHPNVLPVYDLSSSGGQHYIVMRWIGGGSLADLISDHGATTPRRAVEIARKLASALGAAHDLGIVHRDVKPQNVLLDHDGEPYLADFGLATAALAANAIRPGIFVGTPAYSPPEQSRAEAIDARADVYALGAVLYEMLTGRRAFPETEPAKVLERQTSAPAPRPRDVDAGIVVELDEIVASCLEPRREARMPSARELEARLARCAGEVA